MLEISGYTRAREDNPSAQSYRIGELTSLIETKHSNTFECAAWSEQVVCQPQTVEISSNGYYFFFGLNGIIVDSHFPTVFGGMQYGNADRDREALGKPGRTSSQIYLYSFADFVEANKDKYSVSIDPDFLIETEHWVSSYDGSACKGSRLFKRVQEAIAFAA